VIGALAAIAALWLLGRGLRPRGAEESTGEALGLDFLFGAGLGSLVFFLFALRSIVWAFVAVYGTLLVSVVIEAIRGRGLPRLRFERSAMAVALLLLASVHILRGFRDSLAGDGYAHWGWKSKAMYLTGRVPTERLQDRERFGYANPDYPFLWPSLQTWTYLHMGEQNDEAVRILGAAFLLALAGVFVGRLRIGTVAALAAAIVLLAPRQWIRSGASGLAEPPLCAYLFAGLAAVAEFAESPSKSAAARAGFFLGFAGWTKNDGLAAVAVGGMLLGILAIRKQGGRPAAVSIGLFAIVVISVLLPWDLYKHVHDIRGYYSIGTAPVSEAGARLELIALSLKSNAMDFHRWLLIWPVLLVGVTLALPSLRRSASARVYLLGGTGIFLCYLAALLLSPLDPGWQIPTTMPRLLMQVEAPLVWCVAFAAQEATLASPARS